LIRGLRAQRACEKKANESENECKRSHKVPILVPGAGCMVAFFVRVHAAAVRTIAAAEGPPGLPVCYRGRF